MLSKALYLKASAAFLLMGLISSSCSRAPSYPTPDLPGFEESFPQIDSDWLAEKFHQSQADGVFVLMADGTLHTQQLGRPPTPDIAPKPKKQLSYLWYRELDYHNPARIAQLPTILFLIEPGCKAEILVDMFEICHAIEATQDTYLVEWNQENMIEQRTRNYASHTQNYPEYGIFLEVEAAQSSSGTWHYRWGNPMGAFNGAPLDQEITEQPYPWTELETLPALIAQLKANFQLDKTIHLRMNRNQRISEILKQVEAFHQAGFRYVQIN